MNTQRRKFLVTAMAFAAPLAFSSLSRGQNMLAGVDLSSPAFTRAELTRADIEAMIARRSGGAPLNLSDKSLNGLDLSKLDLSGANLREARLNNANFAGADLHGAQLDQVWALKADFTGANLSGASLFGTQMQGAKMDGANFTHARLAGDFTGASLKGANLSDSNASADMKNQSMGLMRAILRAGAYELLRRADIPARVAIKEYVDVAGAFFAREESGMVNAVLDTLARKVRAEEFST